MRIINLSLDRSLLDGSGAAGQRLAGYADRLESLTVLVPADKDRHEARGKLLLYGIGGPKAWAWLKMYFLAGNLIRRKRPDLISVQDQYFLALLAFLLAKRYRLGWEMQVHGFEKMSGPRRRLFAFLVRRADAVRTVSRRFEGMLVGDFGVDRERITVVPVGVIRVTRNVERVTHDKDVFVFLSVGRLVAVKRFDLLINAFADVCGQMTGARLLIAGEGEERRNLEDLIKERGVADKVELLGWQNDLSGLYSRADAFCLASDSEGWGMAVVEAMSYGLPIIMTEVGLAGEVVVNEESGLVVPVGDRTGLGQALLRIYQDRELQIKLGQGAEAALAKLPDEVAAWELYMRSWKKAAKKFSN